MKTVTVNQASIADLIEQRDELLEALKMLVEEKADYMRLNYLGDPETQHTVKRARAAIAKASPIVGLTEIGEEDVKNNTRSQSEPVLTPTSAIGEAENGGPKHMPAVVDRHYG